MVVVSRNAIGVNVQVPSFDIARLMRLLASLSVDYSDWGSVLEVSAGAEGWAASCASAGAAGEVSVATSGCAGASTGSALGAADSGT